MTIVINNWTGDSQAVSQTAEWIVSSDVTNHTLTLTINNKSVSITTAGGTGDTARLVAAIAAANIPEFNEITWTATSASVGGALFAVGTPGVPFVAELFYDFGPISISSGGDAAGPNIIDDPQNWSLGSVPGSSSEDVYIDNTNISLLYTLGGPGSYVCNSLNIGSGFTGTIGLPLTNANGYQEYRTTQIPFTAAKAYIGQGDGAGSGLIRLAFGATAVNVIVYNTGSPIETGVPSVVVDADNSSSVVQVLDGSVGIGVTTKAVNLLASLQVGQAAQQASILSNSFSSGSSSTSVATGPNTTATTVTVSSGNVLIDTTGANSAGPTTINQFGGTLEIIGSGATTTINALGGTCVWASTGTITTAAIGSTGILDFTQQISPASVTVTNPITIAAGGTLKDPIGAVSSLVFETQNCLLSNVTLQLPFNKTYTLS